MNSIQLQLLELLQMAETPLYSAYRWLSRQLGSELSLAAFLDLVNGLLEKDVIRLWRVDAEAEEKKRWTNIPEDLAAQYLASTDLDDSFDPFELSLTVGPAAAFDSRLLWEVDIDFENHKFELRAETEALADAKSALGKLFPNVEFVERLRSDLHDGVMLRGTILTELRHEPGSRDLP